MGVLLPAVAALAPLVIAPGILFYFDVTPKVFVLLVGAAIALVWCAVKGKGLSALLSRRTGRWFCALVGLQLLSLSLSTAFSTHPALSVAGTNWRRFGLVTQGGLLLFVLVLAIFLATGRGRIQALLRWTVTAGLLAAIYAAAQYFGWDPWLPSEAYHVGEGIWTIVRPPSTLGYANYAGTYFLYVVFLGVALAWVDSHRAWQFVGVAAAGLGSAAILFTGTRAAILGLVTGVLVLVVWRRPRITWRRIAAVFAVAAALAGFYFSPAGWQLRSRTRWYIEDPWGGARRWLWRDSLRMGIEQWGAGWGPETFSTEFPRFQSKELAKAYPEFYHESPHNIFLDMFAAQGIPGAVVLLLLSGLGCYAGFVSRNSDKRLAAALGAAFAAGLVSQQFTSFIVPTALYFYLTLAALVSLSVSSIPEFPKRRRRSWLLAGFLFPLAGLLVFYSARLVAADRALARVKAELDAGNVREATRTYASVTFWPPGSASADFWYSRRLAQFAAKSNDIVAGAYAFHEGLKAAERAAELAEDRHNAFYNLAAFYATLNDFPHTEASLREAIRWAPNWFKPHWTLARALRRAGRLEEAGKEAALAAELSGGKHAEVAQTLEDIRKAKANKK